MPYLFASKKHRSRSAVLLSAAVSLAFARSALADPPNSNYRLVFADEFNGTSLDSTKWSAANPGWTMPNSASTASASQVSVDDGVMTMNGTRTSSTAFSSGSISSYNKFSYTGGYVEARIQLPSTVGSWPAFWGLYTGWPPEADIMEYPLTSNGSTGVAGNQYNTNFHYATSGGGNSAGAGVVTAGSNLAGTWHTFGMDWVTSTDVVFYLDGTAVDSYYGSSVSQMAYMYMIFDYAIGGWPGTPSTAQWPVGFSDETKVDWVRVWQNNPNGDTTTNWNVSGGGSLNTAGNWTLGAPAYGNQVASFGRVGSAATAAISMNSFQTFGGITFNGSAGGTTAYTLGTSANSIQLSSTTGSTTVQATALSTVSQTINANVELWSNTSFINNMTGGQTLTVNGNVSGSGVMTVSGAGTVVLSGANYYTGGTTIGTGGGAAVLEATSNSALGTGSVTFDTTGNASTARLELAGNSTQTNTIFIAGRNNNSVAIENLSGNNTLSGTVSIGTGGGNDFIQSDAGLLTLSNATALTSTATGSRTATLQGAGNGEVTGAVTNGSATLALTVAGPGQWSLSGANSYAGPTTITGGTLALTGGGSINTTSGITINGTGAKFLQLSSTAGSAPITLTNGTLDGIGTVGAVSVASNSANVITNGNGSTGVLTLSALSFAGAATDNVLIAGGSSFSSPGQVVTNTLTTPSTSGAITLNVGAQGLVNGSYNLIQYGSLAGGGYSAYALGTVASLGNHQTATLGTSGSSITLTVGGDLDQFTGGDSNVWQSGSTGSNHNFRLSNAGTAIDYADGDAVLFDDTIASGTYTLSIGSSLAPAWTTFNNSSLGYIVNSTGGFGIGGSGGLTKNGTAPLTLSTYNTYTGGTFVNAGTLNLGVGGSNGAISGALTINSGATVELNAVDALGRGTGTSVTQININGGTLDNATSGNNSYQANWILTGGRMTSSGGGAYNIRTSIDSITANASATTSTIFGGIILRDGGGALLPITVAAGTASPGLLISGSISQSATEGANGIVKSGAGLLTLSGNNTYTGGTTINAGTVSIRADGNLGSTGSPLTLNGGTLQTTALITDTHPITIGAAGGTINVTTTGQYFLNTTNLLQGSGPLTLTGNGTLVANTGNLRLAQEDSYNGTLTVSSGGILEYGTWDAIDTAAKLTIANQGEVAVQGGAPMSMPNNITVTGSTNSVLSFENGTTGVVTGNIALNSGSNLTVGLRDWYNYSAVRGGMITGVISGLGGLTVNSGTGTGGTLNLSGANTFTGNVVVNGAALDASNDVNSSGRTNGSFGNPSVSGRTVTINSGGSVVMTVGNVLGTGSQTATPALSFVVNPGGLLETAAADAGVGGGGDANIFGNITLNGGTFTVGNGANAAYQSVILLGTVSVTGTTPSTINTNATNIADNGVMLGTSGGTTFNVSVTGGTGPDLTVSAPLTVASGGSGGALIKTGAGTMLLSAANTFAGNATINAGTLNLSGSVNNTAASFYVVNGAGTAALNVLAGGNLSTGTLYLAQGGNSSTTATATGTLASGSTINTNGYFVIGSSGLNSLGTFTDNGGTINVRTGTTGNLQVATSDSSSGVFNINSGSTVNLLNNALFILGAQNTSGRGTVNQEGGNVKFFSNAGTTLGGTGQLILASAANPSGTFTYNLDGGILTVPSIANASTANSPTSLFNFNGGTLRPTGSTTTFMQGLSSAVVRTGGANLDTNSFNVTVAQPLIHDTTGPATDGGLNKLGFGTLLLTGASTYTGNTTVSAGTLSVRGLLPATTNMTVAAGASFDLAGTTQTIASLSGPAYSLVTLGSGTLNLNTAGSATFGGTISGTGSVVMKGLGLQALGGDDTYTGMTTVAGGTLNLGANQNTNGVLVRNSNGMTINGGTLIAGSATSHANRDVFAIGGTGLSISGTTNAWTGTLDLRTNDLDIVNAGVTGLATVANQIGAGYANGAWNGPGIDSSSASTDSSHLTALGVILNGSTYGTANGSLGTFDTLSPGFNDVLVKYTYYGDANLDGMVDGSDYSLIDNGYLNGLTGWGNGDFNYDGVIDGTDYTLIDNAFNAQGASLTAQVAAQIAGTSAVPEPVSSGVVGMVMLAALGRRRMRVLTTNHD